MGMSGALAPKEVSGCPHDHPQESDSPKHNHPGQGPPRVPVSRQAAERPCSPEKGCCPRCSGALSPPGGSGEGPA